MIHITSSNQATKSQAYHKFNKRQEKEVKQIINKIVKKISAVVKLRVLIISSSASIIKPSKVIEDLACRE